jgi:hypothetical protein
MDLQEQLRVAGLEEEAGLWRDTSATVGAALTDSGVFVGWLDVSWPGPGTPEPLLRDVEHLPTKQAEREIEAALERAHRQAERCRRECRYCGGRFVPGHMYSRDVCQGCAERELGVVY